MYTVYRVRTQSWVTLSFGGDEERRHDHQSPQAQGLRAVLLHLQHWFALSFFVRILQ
jgi:hypothetical protein